MNSRARWQALLEEIQLSTPINEPSTVATRWLRLAALLLPLALAAPRVDAGQTPESLAGRPAAALEGARLAALNAFVEKARQQLQVPGVAVGILQGDRVVLARGYGVRRLGLNHRPDADTLFMVGSASKPLTSLLMARLVDQGRLSWSTPVAQLLPELRLADPALTAQLQARHLLCACSGVPRRDLPLFLNFHGVTPEGMLQAMAALKPTAALGSTFHYSNQMVAAAGFLAGRAAFPALEPGAAYDRAMTELLFHPLGMAATTLGFDEALRRPNLAWPHGFNATGRLVGVNPAVNRSVVPARPSGGVWSNVNDMLRYVALELREGRLADGQLLLSRAAMRERRTPQVTAGENVSYGLGLVIDRSLGTPLLEHSGSTAGYQSLVFWLPEHQLGAVVLSNGDQGAVLALLLQQRLLELVLGARPEAEAELPRQRALFRAQRQRTFQGLSLPPDPRAAARLASRYRSPDLGVLQVRRQGRRILFDFGGFVSSVGSRRSNGGSWAFVTSDAGQPGLEFLSPDRDGRTLLVRENQHTYRYTAE